MAYLCNIWEQCRIEEDNKKREIIEQYHDHILKLKSENKKARGG